MVNLHDPRPAHHRPRARASCPSFWSVPCSPSTPRRRLPVSLDSPRTTLPRPSPMIPLRTPARSASDGTGRTAPLNQRTHAYESDQDAGSVAAGSRHLRPATATRTALRRFARRYQDVNTRSLADSRRLSDDVSHRCSSTAARPSLAITTGVAASPMRVIRGDGVLGEGGVPDAMMGCDARLPDHQPAAGEPTGE